MVSGALQISRLGAAQDSYVIPLPHYEWLVPRPSLYIFTSSQKNSSQPTILMDRCLRHCIGIFRQIVASTLSHREVSVPFYE